MNHPFYIFSGTMVYLFIPSVERWYVLSSMVRRYISFYIISGTVVYLFMPSVERWCELSSVVRQYISFIVSGTSMNYLFLYHQWYGGISLHTFSGTLVYVIVNGTAVHLFHLQWYVDELSLFISSVVRWYISSYLQWNVGMCYRQWYRGTSLSSSVVRR